VSARIERSITLAALVIVAACAAPRSAPGADRYVRVAVLEPRRPPDRCFHPLNSVYELRPDSQWIAIDSGVVTCHDHDALGGVYAFGTHYGTAWGSYSRRGKRLWLAGDSIRQDDAVAEINHFSRAAELRGDSLVFLTGMETGPAMIYVRVPAR